jgi:hypothetical protein
MTRPESAAPPHRLAERIDGAGHARRVVRLVPLGVLEG